MHVVNNQTPLVLLQLSGPAGDLDLSLRYPGFMTK